MITISQIKNGATYLSNHLSANDYYSEGEQIDGEWWGQGAERLGLEGKVTEEAFEALRTNRSPATGEKLTARDGKKNAFHDITLSAPKSVSIVAVVGEDERVREAFRESVAIALKELEKNATVRYRVGRNHGTENVKTTGNIIAGVFHHDASRLLDPQLHAHAVIANASFDESREGWFALQPRKMMEESVKTTLHFRADLAHRIEQLGYKVQWTGQSFRIEGVSQELEHQFSQRTQQRERFSDRFQKMFGKLPSKKRVERFIKDGKTAATKRFHAEFSDAYGKAPTKQQADEFVQEWRDSKLKTVTTPEVREIQTSRLTENTQGELRSTVHQAKARSGLAQARAQGGTVFPATALLSAMNVAAKSSKQPDQPQAVSLRTQEQAEVKPNATQTPQLNRRWEALRLWRRILATQSQYRKSPQKSPSRLRRPRRATSKRR